MPLGKIINLLKGVIQNISSEQSVDTSDMLIEENNAEVEARVAGQQEPTLAESNAKSTTESIITITQEPLPSLPKILEEKIMINTSMLQDVLQGFVSGSADVQGAALVSPDGLPLASVLPGDMDEERTAAMSAAMLSLGERIGGELARGSIDRIVVEGEKGYGVLVGCGADAVLLVLAGAGVKQGILFLEIKRVVTKITPLLA
ncbi:MAG: roadblock/LC7 domain-containing protein [Sphaerospermopsis sp.]|nr:roadblock/LC7 domain-containing protein [Sphaerospermopsis sp.]